MGQISNIEWTESTWNPVTGCTKISPGCENCYAERMALRLRAMGQPRYQTGFELAYHEEALSQPLRWRQPRMIFVNSMSDLFHKQVPLSFIRETFHTMQAAHWHTFQILTKRATRLAQIAPKLPWPPNIWMGVSVESAKYTWRIDKLTAVPAATRFISFAPLLAPVSPAPLEGVHWVIAGGESGPGARPVDPEWVRQIRDSCLEHEVPFFFKQWGGVQKHRHGRTLDGQVWSQMPSVLQPA